MNLSLCREDGRYRAGGTLTAKWRVRRVPIDQVQGIEVSVLWYTEGKGDEDFAVHHFHRAGAEQLRRSGLSDERSLNCCLPATPLSYQGRLISIRWCIRLRLFLDDGREIVAEQPFHLVACEFPVEPDLTALRRVDETRIAEPSSKKIGATSEARQPVATAGSSLARDTPTAAGGRRGFAQWIPSTTGK